ncbi:Arylsulfatase [Stieleria bergensis]|uniref:Arylsulfatase n=2 Tax=Stieleria bergensis TaxID=2528025 RepID=A0A517T136_9BACT|nr:Arylsulfatase [Planctomycetes bacterium SV_7m_r]
MPTTLFSKASLMCGFALICLLTRTLALPAATAAQQPLKHRPNILIIFTDDQGVNDVGCYGSEIPTPNIDSLAKQGIQLNQFYAASSICTPSRFGLLTGRYAQRSQDRLTGALMFLEQRDLQRGIRQHERMFVKDLQQAGYQTHLVGKWHLGHGDKKFWPTEHGFDSFFGHTGGCVDFFTCQYANKPDWYRGRDLVKTTGYATDVITDEALNRLDQLSVSDRPWLMHLAYNAPHFGKGWDEATQSAVNIMQPKPADLKQVQSINDPLRRAFAAKVVGMDKSIGLVLKKLNSTGMDQNTFVIFMTDHGGDAKYGGSNKPLRGGKATLFEGGIRVPCLVRFPGVIQPGSHSNAVASALDWYPTLAELTRISVPKTLDGQSLMPILTGKPVTTHRPIVWATGAHESLERKAWAAARIENWKWVRPPQQKAMLFDLETDPTEQTNLAAKHPALMKRMRTLVDESFQGQ